MSTEAIPEEFAGHLRSFGVTAIDHVEKQQASYLCARAGIEPVLTACPSAFSISNRCNGAKRDCCVGRAKSFGRATLGGKNYVYIRGIEQHKETNLSASHAPPGQLLLRAPSAGLLRQYDRAMRRLMRMIRHWLKSSSANVSDDGTPVPAVALGAGTVELAGEVWCQHIAERLQHGKSNTNRLALPRSFSQLLTQCGESGMVSSAEAVAAFKALGAMLGLCPQRWRKILCEKLVTVDRLKGFHVRRLSCYSDGPRCMLHLPQGSWTSLDYQHLQQTFT